MPRIRITGKLPKAAGGTQIPMGPFVQPDDNNQNNGQYPVQGTPTINGIKRQPSAKSQYPTISPWKPGKWSQNIGVTQETTTAPSASNPTAPWPSVDKTIGMGDAYFNKWKTPAEIATKNVQIPMAPEIPAVETTTTAAPVGFGKRLKSDINIGTNLLGSALDYAQKKEQQNFTNNQIAANSLYDNMMGVKPQSTSGLRGNWDKNNGQWRQNEQGWKNEGMYNQNAAYGGTIKNPNPMKNNQRIRITGGPDTAPSMAYGGQLGYSLNLGAKRLYTDMPEAKSDNVSSTLQAVPRDEANIEAEKGETLWGDVDADGAMEHMEIGGNKHTHGGTPLNAPEGSFIFSDTAKLKIKDPKILDKFGMTPRKEGWTPAEIAKRYDVNKYKAIMEDPQSDPIRKSTAQIMIKNFTKKLSELSLVQEQMKGFPQGIPDVAKKANSDLQTKEDQQIQPGLSVNPDAQQPQQGGPEPNGVQEYPQGQEPNQSSQQPTMAYGGLVQGIDDFVELPKAAGGFSMNTPYSNYLANNNIVSSGNVSGIPQPISAQTVAPAPVAETTDAQGNIVYGQTFTPAKHADLNDPEYQEFLTLMKRLDTGKMKGQNAIYINKLESGDANRLAQLATKFGFKRDAQGNVAGHRIVQGATPGYSWNTNVNGQQKQIGFFGGYTPEMYEKKVMEGLMGKEASDKMSDVQRRRAYFKSMGIDDTKFSDAQLANTRGVYNKNFFQNIFYPAFTKKFAQQGYRPEMKDDMMMGAEHFDALQVKPPEVVSTTTYPEVVTTTTYPPPGTVITTTAKPGPFDYMTPDKVNFAAAVAGRPNKYLPWASRIPFEGNGVAFEDWRAKAAERQGMMNRTASQLNTYSPGSATAANLSFLNAQSGEGLIGDIAATDARNVGIANQHMAQEGQRKDQNTFLNWQQQQELYKGNAIANQQYDNASNIYNNNLAKTFGNAWNNRMKLGMLNDVNPVFKVDPTTGRSNFTSGYGQERLGSPNPTGGSADWAATAKDFNMAKTHVPGLTFDQYLHMQNKTTVSDTNNDGIPNSVRKTGYAPAGGYGPNYGLAMAQMYNQFGTNGAGQQTY